MDDDVFGLVNTLRRRQNERHFADDIFNCVFLNANVWIPIKISLKFVPKGQIDHISALGQILAWRRPGDKPLSEPMMFSLPTHICVFRHQWVKISFVLTIRNKVYYYCCCCCCCCYCNRTVDTILKCRNIANTAFHYDLVNFHQSNTPGQSHWCLLRIIDMINVLYTNQTSCGIMLQCTTLQR